MQEGALVALAATQIVIIVLLIKRSGSAGPGDKFERALKQEMALNRKEAAESSRSGRKELADSIKAFGDSLDKRMHALGTAVETRLNRIQQDNTTQLEKMRVTVDEKLQSTLEKRLGESFKHVSDRLERVHRGLGEMQTLAADVGDFKKILSNVKARGTWGEIQLGSLLKQILNKEQYATNVAVKPGSSERVEFAIKIPNKEDGKFIYLPIDCKFPLDGYHKLIEAHDKADIELIKLLGRDLERQIKQEAKTIYEKYIDPPHTTDFAILYLPIEGLYAEVTQRTEVCELIRRQYKVAIAGPNTVLAVLNFLQMGFRALAIQERTSDVWELLDAVKTEFGRFGDLLDKTKKKLQEAGNTIDIASSKSRTIERKLNQVQRLAEPEEEVNLLAEESFTQKIDR